MNRLAPNLAPGSLSLDASLRASGPPEMKRRDRQAAGYLQHSKLPVQVDRLRRFIERQPRGGLVYDLGCGPGPTTRLLLDAGYRVVGVDFSAASLELNRLSCPEAAFLQADLTTLEFEPRSADGLMMADFLQHIPGPEGRADFLRRAFSALKPGGWFFLSFFNLNIVNRIKRDAAGAFGEDGAIRYTRLRALDVLRSFPSGLQVRSVRPMNILADPVLDRVACGLPGARFLSRMTVVTGIAR